jgi:hypothetical protein
MHSFKAFLQKRPLFVSLVSNTAKAIMADIVTQKVIENKKELDIKRVGVFGLFGLTYLGGWQYCVFNKAFVKCEHIMTNTYKLPKAAQAVVLTSLDMGVHTPLMYYPAFYAIKGHMQGITLSDSMKVYKNNFNTDMIDICKLWVPVQIVNFTFLPIYMRMPCITGVSFIWTMLLSFKRGEAHDITS